MRTFFIAIISWALTAHGSAEQTEKVGFGITNSFINNLAVESFITGFSFAISKSRLKDLVDIESNLDHSPLSATVLVRKMLKNYSALLGFPGSHDCLLAAKEVTEKNIPAIFLNCTHNDLKKYSGKVASTMSDLDDEVNTMIDFLNHREAGRSGVAIIHPDHVSSRLQGQLYAEAIKQSKLKFSLKVVELSHAGKVAETELAPKSQQLDFLILTPYPDLLQPLREQLVRQNLGARLYGSSAWDNFDVARRFLLNLKNDFVYPTTWNRESSRSVAFVKAFNSRYGKDPSPESAYGYDLAQMLLQIDKNIPGTLLSKKIAQAIADKRCFENLLAGPLCLGNRQGHSQRNLIFVKITPKGIVRVAK